MPAWAATIWVTTTPSPAMVQASIMSGANRLMPNCVKVTKNIPRNTGMISAKCTRSGMRAATGPITADCMTENATSMKKPNTMLKRR